MNDIREQTFNLRAGEHVWQADYENALAHALTCIGVDIYWDEIWWDENGLVRL